jgi:hypothetical protein
VRLLKDRPREELLRLVDEAAHAGRLPALLFFTLLRAVSAFCCVALMKFFAKAFVDRLLFGARNLDV